MLDPTKRCAGVALLLVLGSACAPVCRQRRLPTCDIREESCHALVQEAVRCMRGAASDTLPPVAVIGVPELEARLREGADPMMMRPLAWEGALKLLGMLDPDADFYEESMADAVANIAALYSPVEDALFVVDRGMPLDSPDAVAALAHELVHAAQDEVHDLDAMLSEADTHEDLARTRFLVEGEATFYTLEAYGWMDGLGPESIDWERTFSRFVADVRHRLDSARSPYFVVYRAFPYAFGGRWQAGRWEMGGDPAVRASLVDPPSSSAWLMTDPWSASPPPPPRAERGCDPPPPPGGFERYGSDEMGAPLVHAFLRRFGMSHEEAHSIALGWARDDLDVYSGPDGRVALAWRITLTSGADAVVAQMSAHADRFRVGHDRSSAGLSSVVLLTANDPFVTAGWRWTAPAPCAPPP